MKNIAFSIWAVGYPIALSISTSLSTSDCGEYSVTVEGLSAIMQASIWGFVAYKLYEK